MSEFPAGAAHLRVLEGEAGPASPAWESLYRDNVRLVYRFVYSRVGNRFDAEDLTSEVFLRSLPRLRREAHPGEVRGYLLAAARTVLADFWAREYSVPVDPLGEHPADDGDDAGAAAVAGRAATRVEELLRPMPGNYRTVLELRFLRGYSVKETAAAIGVSVANAKVLQWRALRRAARLDGGDGP